MKMITLNNGMQVPQIGFGTFKATNVDGYRTVADAIQRATD